MRDHRRPDDPAGARAASELRDLGLDSDHVLLDVTDPDCLTRETAAMLVDLQLLRATFGTNLFGAAATVMEAAAFIADAATGSHDLTSGSFADAQGPVPW